MGSMRVIHAAVRCRREGPCQGCALVSMQEGVRMQRSAMTPKARRAWAIGLVAFFVLLFAAVGFSQWWAYHVNVPAYDRSMHGRGGAQR